MKSLLIPALAATMALNLCAGAHSRHTPSPDTAAPDSIAADSIAAARSMTLSEDDYREVAEELGVEVAAIKAVVDIEAGARHEGFSAPGVPLINFDLAMFRRFAGKKGINLTKYYRSHPTVFNTRRKLSQSVQNERLRAARSIDNTTAIEGTFWGMFQIGGFNWRKCGATSPSDFVEQMSRSERQQLELFGKFITNTGLLSHLRAKNWSAFARGYNGASYARRGYHTRLASSYQRHKQLEKQAAEKTEE